MRALPSTGLQNRIQGFAHPSPLATLHTGGAPTFCPCYFGMDEDFMSNIVKWWNLKRNVQVRLRRAHVHVNRCLPWRSSPPALQRGALGGKGGRGGGWGFETIPSSAGGLYHWLLTSLHRGTWLLLKGQEVM